MTNSMRSSRRAAALGSFATLAAALLVSGTAVAAPTKTSTATTPSKPSKSSMSSAATQSYRVTIQNLAPQHADTTSQALSSALVVVHDRSVDLFTVGDAASASVIAVAQEANAGTGVSALTGVSGVYAVSSEGSSIQAGASSSFEVSVQGNDRYLSLVSKLVNTNDAFVGLDAVHLTGGTKTYRIFALDAGSEVNDQLAASIPGPCCNNMTQAGTSESLKITRHTGIVDNVGDLTPALWGWPVNEPIALVTVERLR